MSNKAKVFIVDRENKAQHKIFFVDRENKEKNTALIDPGVLVKRENDANIKVFIVDRENKADILITRENFPKAS